jgi:predicted NAD/FAD-binding protein
MKHVISIGINNVSGLIPLNAAASGAKEFADWATSQGYKTTVFTDEGNIPVSQAAIFATIMNIINDKNCEKLVIFFSGHGILKSPSQEIW